MKKRQINYKLSDGDVEAILTSLPLVLSYPADTDEQQELNVALSESAAKKLFNCSSDFTANEFRVIYFSVCLAKEYLSGHIDIDIDPEEKSELKKYLFTYNKLEKAFTPLFDGLCK